MMPLCDPGPRKLPELIWECGTELVEDPGGGSSAGVGAVVIDEVTVLRLTDEEGRLQLVDHQVAHLRQGFRRQVYLSSGQGPAPLTAGTLVREFYDTEHVPERMAVPGFQAARRYVGIAGSPGYLAVYDMESPDVLKSDAYLKVSFEKSSPWTKRVVGRARVQRDVGQMQFAQHQRDGIAAPIIARLVAQRRPLDAARPASCPGPWVAHLPLPALIVIARRILLLLRSVGECVVPPALRRPFGGR